jgi:DNA-directed RNA polymerase subunit RPC12/RpoP
VSDKVKNYENWVARYEAKKKGAMRKLAVYKCPKCEHELKCPKPARGDVFDTLATCPYCEAGFWRVTFANGQVTATLDEDSK